MILKRLPTALRASLRRQHFGPAPQADRNAYVGRPCRRPPLEQVSTLVVDPHRLNFEVPSQLADAAISIGLVLTKRVRNKKAQLDHCRRIVTPPVQKAVEQSLRRRSDKRSDLFAIWLWQLRRVRHGRPTATHSYYQEARCSPSRL